MASSRLHCGLLAVPLTLALAACGDDGSTGSTSGTGTDTEAGSTSSTGSTSSGTSAGSGTAGGSTGGSTGAGSTTGATTVTLNGDVNDRVLDTAIADAVISVDGMPGFETVSDADGFYTIEGLPPDTEIFVVIDPSTDYFGGIVPVYTESPGVQEQELAQISRTFVENSKAIVEGMGSQTLDMVNKGVIFARGIQNTMIMEGPLTVDLVPAPVMDTYFGLDPAGNPKLNDNATEYSFLPVVLFANLDPAAVGTYMVSGTHPVRTCTPLHPSVPVMAEHITLSDLDCPPV